MLEISVKNNLLLSFLILIFSILGGNAFGQSIDYPNKRIRLVVPFTAGGNTDLSGRLLAAGLSKELHQSVIVENKVGGGTIIGTEDIARSKPDGYNLLMTTIAFAVNPALRKSLPYDSLNDFEPVALTMITPSILLTSPSTPASDLKGFIAYLKSRSDATYGSAGIGSAMHLAGELFKSQAGISATHIPYKGESQALPDLLSGRTTFQFGGAGTSAQYIRSGQLKGFAVAADQRLNMLPEVPTFSEAGLQNFDGYTWGVIFAPRGTPNNIIHKLNEAINKISKESEYISKHDELGIQVISNSTPASTRKFVKQEIEKWGTLIDRIGMKAE